MRSLRIAALAATLSFALAACGGGGGSTSTPGGSSSQPTSTGSSSSSSSAASDMLTLTAPSGAANSGFAEKTLSAPADTPLTIVFTNDDAGIPHNVQIYTGTDTTATPVFAPADNAMITGAAEATYEVPALAAGTYTYTCFAHPATMVGTLTVA